MKVIVRVTIGDLMLRNSELDLLEVTQELGQHTTCKIAFTRDSATDVSLDQLLRDPVSVKVQGEGGPLVELFQGYVADGVQTHLLHAGSRFVLDAVSSSERLDYVDTVYFPESTLASIAGKFNVTLVHPPRRTPPAFDYVQWGESEFVFLRRLADEHGCFLVTHLAEPELRSQFDDKGIELKWGETLLELSARARPTNHGITGASYDVKQKSTHAHAGVRQAPTGLGGAGPLLATASQLAGESSGGGDSIVYEATGRDATHADLKASLRRESERALGGAVLVEGGSIETQIAAGDLVTLVTGLKFVLPTIGKVGLIKVVHRFAEQQYGNSFVATPWKGFTSLERFEAPKMAGPVTAEVIETADDPDQMGRVRVAYRWHAGDGQTNWARLATVHAGNGRGIMFLPEVGDEVLVAFEHGDVERPIIIGSLWNGRDKAPESTQDNTAKRIITRSGNTIQLLDDDGQETIEVFTPDGKCLIQLTNANGHPVVTVKSGGDIALEAEEEIRLTCSKLVQEVKGDSVKKVSGNESIDASQNVTIKAGMDLGLAGLNATLKGGINVDSVAGALNNIVGAMVHIQPPGFVPKQVTPKPVQVTPLKVGDRPPPEPADPQRTADPDTPRG
jgi:uncharacterized protein involved in type VI secretion and phage assembly